MCNFITKIFKKKPSPIDEAIAEARFSAAKAVDKQKTEIMKLNQELKFIIESGSVEIVIKGIKDAVEKNEPNN